MKAKRFSAAVAVIAAVVLIIGTGTSQSKVLSVQMFPMLAKWLQSTGQSSTSTTANDINMPPPPPPPHGSPLLRCIGELDISSDTKSSIDALVKANEETKQQDAEAHKTLMDAYVAALTASPIDEDALATAQDGLVTSMQADMKSNFALDASIVTLLTAEQLTELSTCMANSGPPSR
jgi:Spy/CpxP family protein refolding chaperone